MTEQPIIELRDGGVTPVGETKPPDLQSTKPFRLIDPLPFLVLPRDLLFAASPDHRLRFKRAIPIKISREKEVYVAHAPEIEEFGYGESVAQCLDDFGKTVLELFWTLSEEKDRLGPDLQSQFAKLNTFLEVRQPA